MDPHLAAGVAALVVAAVHAAARRFEEALSGVPRSRWLSFGGGVSVAYVFVHMLPELANAQVELESDGALVEALRAELWVGALAGLVVFYGLERLAARRSEAADPGGPGPRGDPVGWLHLSSYALYNTIAGYLLLEQAEIAASSLVVYTVAIAVHFLVNDHGLVEDHGALYRRVGRWLLAGAVVVGWLVSVVGGLDARVVPALTAFLAGGIILNVIKEELPEERRSRFGVFAAAAGGYAALLLAI